MCWRWWWNEAPGPSVQRSGDGTELVHRSCRAVLSHRVSSGWDKSRRRHDVHSRRTSFVAACTSVAGHHHAGSYQPDRSLHDGTGLSVCLAGSRSCCATGVCGPLVVHRCSRAVGTATGAQQGAAEGHHRRERAAADRELVVGSREPGTMTTRLLVLLVLLTV